MPVSHAIGDAEGEDQALAGPDEVAVIAKHGRLREQLLESLGQVGQALILVGSSGKPFDKALDPLEQRVQGFLSAPIDDRLGDDEPPFHRQLGSEFRVAVPPRFARLPEQFARLRPRSD